MKNIIKKISVFVITASMLMISVSTSISANEDYDSILLEWGVPKEILDTYSNEKKADLVNRKFDDVSVTEEIVPMDDLLIKEYEGEEPEISTRGLIESNYMVVKTVILASKWNNKTQTVSPTLVEMMVSVSYQWIKPTAFGHTDLWGISWDSNQFRYKEGSFESITGYIRGNQGGIYESTRRFSDINKFSIGGMVNQKYSPGAVFKETLYHTINFTLIPDVPMKSGTVQFYYNYAHYFAPEGMSFSLPSLLGFGVSFSGRHDKMAGSVTRSW